MPLRNSTLEELSEAFRVVLRAMADWRLDAVDDPSEFILRDRSVVEAQRIAMAIQDYFRHNTASH